MEGYLDEEIRLTQGGYPQTAEGSLRYAVDRMLVAERQRDTARNELLALARRTEHGDVLTADDLRPALIRAGLVI